MGDGETNKVSLPEINLQEEPHFDQKPQSELFQPSIKSGSATKSITTEFDSWEFP
jgi:hypothetical protein